MKTAFISRDFQERHTLAAEIEWVVGVLADFGFCPVDFVSQYQFAPGEEVEMMRRAGEQIRQADILIAEVSTKAIGVGIEIGYAAALGKPIVYLRKWDAPYSTTVGGLAAFAIVYQNKQDLAQKLTQVLKTLIEGANEIK